MNEKVVSLFSGAGGLDMGFENQGFHVIWANDSNHDACETHRFWSSAEVVEGDIGRICSDAIPEADVILGGFPCQSFSLAGPRRINDSRNTLYRHFVRIVEQKQPRVFVAENVKGILTLGNGKIIEAIIRDFESRGYRVTCHPVNAADYGVPQERFRVIITGIREDTGFRFVMPQPSGCRTTLREAIGDFPCPGPGEVCQAPYSSRYMSRNRRRGWDEQSYTIPAMAKQVPLHPGSPDMIKLDRDRWTFGNDGMTRRLSYREAAAIQTFPPGMEFAGNLDSRYRQIGNAVPVRLAEAIAGQVRHMLENA